MARPRSYFESKEFNVARRDAKERKLNLYKFSRTSRAGKEGGYYIGKTPPKRWTNATFEEKKV